MADSKLDLAKDDGKAGEVVAPGSDSDLKDATTPSVEDRATAGRTLKPAEGSNAPKNAPAFYADRTADLNPLADKDGKNDLAEQNEGTIAYGTVTRGEELAREAAEDRDNSAGNPKFVKRDGVVSVVQPAAQEDLSDNGRVYKDARIDPRDTNAPDAGLTPDGRRIAE